MLFRTLSAAVYGIDADLVDIEVDLTPVRGEADSPSSVKDPPIRKGSQGADRLCFWLPRAERGCKPSHLIAGRQS